MKRKLIPMVLISSMTLSMFPTISFANTSSFTDIPTDYSSDALKNAVENGLLNGYDNLLKPEDNLTRAELATILVRAFGAENTSNVSYTDVTNNDWFYEAVSKAVAMEAFEGYNNEMRPNDYITREEVFTVLSRLFVLESEDSSTLNNFADASNISEWAKDSTSAMISAGYVQGDSNNKLNPNENIMRKDLAVILNRMVSNYITESGTLNSIGTGDVMINTADVTLKDVTVSGNLILGDGVGDGDIILDNVNVEGQIIVRGGGVNSVVIKGNSKVPKVRVAKVLGDVRVAVEDGAVVNDIIVSNGSKDVILEGTLKNLNVQSKTPIVLKNAKIEFIKIEAEDSKMSATQNTIVNNIAVDAPNVTVVVGNGAEVSKNILATENANNIIIEAETGSKVDSIISEALGTSINNDGTIGNVSVSDSAGEVIYAIGENANTDIVITAETKDNILIKVIETVENVLADLQQKLEELKNNITQDKVEVPSIGNLENSTPSTSTDTNTGSNNDTNTDTNTGSSSNNMTTVSPPSYGGGGGGGGSSSGGSSSNDKDDDDDTQEPDVDDDTLEPDVDDDTLEPDVDDDTLEPDVDDDTLEPDVDLTPPADYPHEVLDFVTDTTNWKLQLPIWRDDTQLTILEKTGTELIEENYTSDIFYVERINGVDWVVMRCDVDGAKTSNTSYSRNEFREMLDLGNSATNWEYTGTHILNTTTMVTEVPSTGITVTSQIHGVYADGENGPVLVKVEYDYKNKAVVVLLKTACEMKAADSRHYFYGVELGQVFDTEIKVTGGSIYVTIESEGRSETFYRDFVGEDPNWLDVRGYFKAGNYVQDSVAEKEGEGATVKLSRMDVYHGEEDQQIAVESIDFSSPSVNLGNGESLKLGVDFTPIDTLNKGLDWEIVSGNEYVALTNDGRVVGLSNGTAVIKAISQDDPTVSATCNVVVAQVEPVPNELIYSEKLSATTETDRDLSGIDLNAGSSNVTSQIVKEDNNYIIQVSDKDNNSTGRAEFHFEPQDTTTTISFDIRVDENELKGDNKPQTSNIYMDFGGQEGSTLSSTSQAFRIRNNADNTTDSIYNNRWGYSHSYLDVPRNASAAEFRLGEWKNITLVITPEDNSASASTTTVYMDGLRVSEATSNNVAVDMINQVNIYSGTADIIGFSLDNIEVYSGIKIPETSAPEPSKIILGTLPNVMSVGNSIQVIAEVNDGANEEVVYSISEGSALAVSEAGLLVAREVGNATLRVSSALNSNVYTEHTIEVKEAVIKVESISLENTSLKLNPEDTYDLSEDLTFNPTNADEKAVSYSIISGDDVISITPEGIITANAVGSASVRVTSLDNSSATTTTTINVFNSYEAGQLIFEDTFSNETLDYNSWETATSNVGNTITEIRNDALFFEDSNVGGQPKANVEFEPQAETFTIQYDFALHRDYFESKASTVNMAFGNNSITSSANEAFRLRTYSGKNGTERYFRYHDTNGSSNINIDYDELELNKWVTIAMTTTPDNGTENANKTDIYINGVLVEEGAENKNYMSTIDKFIFQTGTSDLTAYSIDNFTVWAGDYSDGSEDYGITDRTGTAYYSDDYNYEGNLDDDSDDDITPPETENQTIVNIPVDSNTNWSGTSEVNGATTYGTGENEVDVFKLVAGSGSSVNLHYKLAEVLGESIVGNNITISLDVLTDGISNNPDAGFKISNGGTGSDYDVSRLKYTGSAFKYQGVKDDGSTSYQTISSNLASDEAWTNIQVNYSINDEGKIISTVKYGEEEISSVLESGSKNATLNEEGLIELTHFSLFADTSSNATTLYYKDISIGYSTTEDDDGSGEDESKPEVPQVDLKTVNIPVDDATKWSIDGSDTYNGEDVFKLEAGNGSSVNMHYKLAEAIGENVIGDDVTITLKVLTKDIENKPDAGFRISNAGTNADDSVSRLKYTGGEFKYEGFNNSGSSSFQTITSELSNDDEWTTIVINYSINDDDKIVATVKYGEEEVSSILESSSKKAILNNNGLIEFTHFSLFSDSKSLATTFYYKDISIAYSTGKGTSNLVTQIGSAVEPVGNKEVEVQEDLEQDLDLETEIQEDLEQDLELETEVQEDLEQDLDLETEVQEDLEQDLDLETEIQEDLEQVLDLEIEVQEDLEQDLEQDLDLETEVQEDLE